MCSIARMESSCSASPFVKQLTWASEIGKDGRPVLVPGQVPSPEGTRICPSAHGAANWYSTSYSPQTGLYYVQTLENCNIFLKSRERLGRAGKSYWGGSTRQAPEAPNQKVLRAIDVKTGKVAWELPQSGPGGARGGTLATARASCSSATIRTALWLSMRAQATLCGTYGVNSVWRASPMTYQFDEQQHVAIASGSNIIAFGLVQP